MPESLSKVILQIIKKDREPWLDSDVRPRIHAYLATICRDLGAELVHVGGVSDHVHIVATLPRTFSQAEFIEQIKKTSSKWIKALDARYRGFFWHRGYGAFSVKPESARGRGELRQRAARAPSCERFRRNTASWCTGMVLSLTSGMFGIENTRHGSESRFQRLIYTAI